MIVLRPFEVTQMAWTLLLVLSLSLLVIPLRALQRKLRIAKGLAPIPGPKGVPLLGMIPQFIHHKNRIYHFLEELLRQHGGRMKMPWHLFFDGAIYITSPEDVKHVLATNFDNYIKPQGFIDAFEIFEGSFFGLNHGPHTKDKGAKWKLQRKVAAKEFTTKNFRVYTEQIFDRIAKKMIWRIEHQHLRCDMQQVAARYTLQSIFVIAFGIEIEQVTELERFASMMDFVNEHCASRLFVKQHYKWFWWCMPSEHRVRKYVAQIQAIADKILAMRLAEREEQLAQRFDILSLFIKKARELPQEEADLLDAKTLRAIILTFIFAGRDTTAECITYTFYSIAQHDNVQQQIVEELAKVCPKADESLNYDQVRSLKYLDAVVHEAIRLYPSLPYNLKNAVKDDHLPDGTFVPAGTDVVYSPWFMGRDPGRWKNPLMFLPERWLEMDVKPNAFEFPHFQAGPRICLGMNMAILEASMFAAVILRHFQIEIIGEKERKYILKSGLFMDGGLPLQMTLRKTLQAASA